MRLKLVILFFFPILSACSVAISLMSSKLPFILSFVQLVPLLYIVLTTDKIKNIILICFIYTFILYFTLLWGVNNYGVHIFIISLFIKFINYSFIMLAVNYINKKYSNTPYLNIFIFSILFILIKELFFVVLNAPNFYYVANGTSENLFFQLVSVVGSDGADLIIIFVNFFIAQELKYLFTIKKVSKKQIVTLSLTALFLCINFFHFNNLFDYREYNQTKNNNQVSFSIIQGSVPRSEYVKAKNKSDLMSKIGSHYVNLTLDSQILKQSDVVLWPETSVKYFSFVAKALEKNINKFNLIGGFLKYDPKIGTANSILFIDKAGLEKSRYDKVITVPIAERNYVKGKKTNNISFNNYKIATPICFEALFPNLIRNLVLTGANLIITFTNEAGLKSEGLSYAIAKQTILRGVENNRDVIRVSQSGPSIFASRNGKILKESKFFETTFLKDNVRMYSSFSIYTKYRGFIIIITLFLSLLLFGFIHNKNEKNDD
jgi:apolipoprotein N-acyltransferase